MRQGCLAYSARERRRGQERRCSRGQPCHSDRLHGWRRFTLGTGFLGRRNGVVSFYTAAHNMYGAEPIATPQWVGWYQRVGVYTEVVDKPWPYQAVALDAFSVIQPHSPATIAGNFPLCSWAFDVATM